MRLALLIIGISLPVLPVISRDTMTGSLDERLRTLTVRHSTGEFMAPPVVTEGGGDWLDVSFDRLTDDREYLRWRLVRCEPDWSVSTIPEVQWMDGFNESIIDDYDFSRATTVPYVHYRFTFPNEDLSPTLSGNYLIEIYNEEEPDVVLGQVRVMVSEGLVKPAVVVTSRTDVDYNEGHQQVSVAVETERLKGLDLFNDLTVMIQQNGRYDNEVSLRRPLRVDGQQAIFEHEKKLIFAAGNEYRRFENTSTYYPGMNIESVDYHSPYYHAIITTDQGRAGQSYTYDQTQAGRYLVREYNSAESALEADYIVTHFTLDYPPLEGWMIFIDGDLTDRRFDDRSLMRYNAERGCYEKALLLKQGAYNYQYLAVAPGGQSGRTDIIEGDKYQTQNDYLIKVYARRPMEDTGRLLGVTQITFK